MIYKVLKQNVSRKALSPTTIRRTEQRLLSRQITITPPRFQTTALRPRDLLNDFFTSVMTKTDPIDSEIPIPGPTPETLFSDFTITEEDVRKHLSLMKWNKSSGPDGIQVNVMKKWPNIIPWLCKLYEKSLRTGHCPQYWKDAHITAIHKKKV